MKYKVVFFVFLKITLCCTISSASTDISRPENSEFIKDPLIEGRKIDHDQNISLWFRNENLKLRSAIKIGKICLEDRDCKWNDNNDLICVFQNTNKKIGKCGCPERSKFNRNTLSCTIQRYKRNYPGCTDCYNDNEFFLNGKCVAGIGAKCPEGTECRAKNSICEGGTCQCLSGYQRINQSYCELNQCKENYDVCDPDLSIPCCDNQMQCINVNPELQISHHICVKQNRLGDSCDNNLDCMWISNAKCAEDGTCVCKNDALKYDNICLNKLYSETLDFKYESLFEKDIVTNLYTRMDDRIPRTGSTKNSNTMYGEWCYSTIDCTYGDYRDLVCHNFSKDSSKNFCTCPNGTNYDFVGKKCTRKKHLELMNIRNQKDYESTHIKIHGEWFSVYRGNCSEDIHCEKLINGVCKNIECSCRNGWKIKNETFCESPRTRCDLHKISCTSKEDCFVRNSVCNNSFCDCGEEEYYENGQCISRKNGVGSPCICEQICTGLKYGVCRNNTCECEKNYEVKNGRCAGKHGQACDDSDDCFANNAMCRNKTCDCKDSFFPSGDGCVKGTINLDSKCSVEETCQAIRYSECKDGTCQCLPNYKRRDGNCLGLDQAPCKMLKDCFAKNATCKNDKCDCPDRFYYENDHCYEKAIVVNDACHSQKACKEKKNTECKDGKCQCLPNYKERDGNCLGLDQASCKISEDCFAKNATCKNDKCDCPDRFYFEDDHCYEEATSVDDACHSQKACTNITNTECKDGKCQCLSNYKERDGNCLGLDQAPYKMLKDCFAKNATCKNKKCDCPVRFYYEDNHCYEKAISVDDACHSQKACTNIKNTECKDGKCQCLPNYKKRDGSCLGLDKAPCKIPKDCFAKNATCTDKKCNCPDRFYYEDDHCYEKATSVDDACHSQKACKKIKNTECKDGKCQCLLNYKERDGNCLGLGKAPCETSKDCFSKNATCKSKKCESPNRFHHKDDPRYEKAMSVDDACHSQKACKKIKNTECKNGKCQCLPNFKKRSKRCLGLNQAACKTSRDCFAKNSVCKNKTCECPDQFYYENNHCHEQAMTTDDACHSEKACKNIKNTSCIDNKCRCKENFVKADGSCQPLAFSVDTDNQCPNGFYFQNGYCLHPDHSSCDRIDLYCTFGTLRSRFHAFKEQLIDFKQKVACRTLVFLNFYTSNYRSC